MNSILLQQRDGWGDKSAGEHCPLARGQVPSGAHAWLEDFERGASPVGRQTRASPGRWADGGVTGGVVCRPRAEAAIQQAGRERPPSAGADAGPEAGPRGSLTPRLRAKMERISGKERRKKSSRSRALVGRDRAENRRPFR
jgi:hypothetical protein